MQKVLLESTAYEGLEDATHIDVEVYYSKGGMSLRGYYLSVTPVTRRGDGMVSYMLFSGVKKLLLTTNRYSAKQFEKAVEIGKSEAPALIEHILKRDRAA